MPDLTTGSGLVVVDTESGREVARIQLSAPAHHLTVAPDGRRVFTTLTARGSLAIVDPTTGDARVVMVGGAPDSAVVTPDGRTVLVSDTTAETIAVVDPDAGEVVARIPVGTGRRSSLKPGDEETRSSRPSTSSSKRRGPAGRSHGESADNACQEEWVGGAWILLLRIANVDTSRGGGERR